jgi:glycosyltransferase involved in cell wall biosynthesis
VRICLVIISAGWAGAETVVHELARHLSEREEKVLVVLNRELRKYYSDLPNVQLFDVGPLFSLTGMVAGLVSGRFDQGSEEPSRSTFPGWPYATALIREEMYYRRLRSRLTEVIMDSRVDIVNSHLTSATVLTSFLRDNLDVPMVATLHGLSARGIGEPSGTRWLTSPVMVWRRRRLATALAATEAVTAVSQFELNSLVRCGIRLERKAVVIPNGINVLEIQSASSSTVPLEGNFNLLFPGGGRFVKGGDLLIDALPKVKRQIRGVHLYVAGEVPGNHMLRRLVAANRLEEDVTFTGFLNVQDYRRLLKSVDALVMPSREEGFGIVFLEAMALGKPVIAGNTGGIPELIENGRNGLLVELDPQRIAEAIISLYNRQELRDHIVRNGLIDLPRFDWSNTVGRYVELYTELVREHKTRMLSA